MSLTAEISEVKKLIRLCTYEGVKDVLQTHLSKLESQLPPAVPSASTETNGVENSGIAGDTRSAASSSASTSVSTPSNNDNSVTFTPISDFAWDQGAYGSAFVTIYIDLPGIGSSKDSVDCKFTKGSFDLKIINYNNKNYRLFKDNLDKDIVPSSSKYIVKSNKILIKLGKVKTDIGYDQWLNLSAKNPDRKKNEAAGGKADPMGGIMDMMKDMYDEGDDNMKKIIGEAMMKSRSGMGDKDGGLGSMPPLPDKL